MFPHIVKKQTIKNYVLKNARSKPSFESFLTVLKWSDWEKPEDIVQTFNSADILGNQSKRVVFNIGGNNYRMICKYRFGKTHFHLFICWIGTHAEYTQLCDRNEQYTVRAY